MVKIGTVDPLSLLERKDKWFLGGGKGAIYAPPFPRWLESPGFWDESYFADIRLTRLFTVLFCDFGGHPIRLRGEMVSWRPDRMIIEHRSASHFVRETRVVTEAQEWVSVFELVEGSPVHAFVWSLPELKDAGRGTPWQSLTDCEVDAEGISFDFATAWPAEIEPDRTGIDAENLKAPSLIRAAADTDESQTASRRIEEGVGGGVPGMLPPLTLRVSLSANQPRLSHTVNLAQRHDDPPLWETSLLPQKLRDGRLPGDFKLLVGPLPMEGLVHILQQYELRVGEPLVVSAAVSIAEAPAGRRRSQGNFDVVANSEQAWRAYFASVPQFSSSDPYLTNAYWYRWYGLRLNTVDIPNLPIARSIGFQPMRTETFQVSGTQVPRVQGQDGPGTHRLEADVTSSTFQPMRTETFEVSEIQVPGVQGQDGPGTYRLEADATFSPFITEGVGFFRNFVTYSAQAHLREVAWMHSPRLAIGILENLGKCQRADGSFPGHNYSCRPARDFYHADFGSPSFLLSSLHPDSISLNVVDCFKKYFDWFDENRRGGFLFLIHDQNETGQEYMSRYQFASTRADQWASFAVAGADATHYMMRLAEFLDKFDQSPEYFVKGTTIWDHETYEINLALQGLFDDESIYYCDALPNEENDPTLDTAWWRMVLSPARPAAGLYPLMNPRRVFPDHLKLIYKWLLNPNEFWLPKGFPATALSDITFNQDAEWKDKRLNCPWNGRSWPMVNSHLVDVLANVARSDTSANLNSETQVQIKESSGSIEPGANTENSELRLKAGEALMKAITLLFHEDDPSRPNSYEHYDPITGTPSLYRGYDDYMHSWIVDLIMRLTVGVIPGEDHVDPLPLGVDWIECTEIPHPRGRMSVRIEADVVERCEVIDIRGTEESKIEESKT